MEKIAKFEKVSQERFVADWLDTFGGEEAAIVQVYENLKLPKRATKGSAGYDFYSPLTFTLKPGETIKIPTGIRSYMREDYVLMVFPRSGLGFKFRLQLNNTVGIIDSDYYYSDNEGHIFIKLTNDSNEGKVLVQEAGQGLAQGIFLPFGITEDDEVTEIIAETKYSGNNKGELKKIDKDEITVVVDDKSYFYDLSSEVDVTVNGKNRSLEDLITYFGEYKFTVDLKFDGAGDVKEIAAELVEAKNGMLRYVVDEDYITIRTADISMELDLASSVDVTLDGEDVTLSDLEEELGKGGRNSYIYVELDYNSSGKVKSIDAYWVDEEGALKAVYEGDDEIKVGTKTYAMARNVDIVYRLGASVDEADFRDVDDYDNDLDGLERFLDDCDDAKAACMVYLTLNSSGDVTFIRAIAK